MPYQESFFSLPVIAKLIRQSKKKGFKYDYYSKTKRIIKEKNIQRKQTKLEEQQSTVNQSSRNSSR